MQDSSIDDSYIVVLIIHGDTIVAFKGHFRSDVILYKSDGTELLTTTAPGVIHGPSAHDDPASGNPVRIGGVYRSTPPGVASGDVADILVDSAGRLYVRVNDGHNVALGTTTDPEATGNGSLIAISKRLRTLLAGGLPSTLSGDRLKAEATILRSYGSGVEPWVGTSEEQTALPSATRTSTTTSGDIIHRGRGFLIVCLRITSASGTGGLQFQVSIGSVLYPAYLHNQSPSTPITFTGRFYWAYGPGLRETGIPSGGSSGLINQHVNVPIPRTWRVHVAHNDSSPYTYSVTYWEL